MEPNVWIERVPRLLVTVLVILIASVSLLVLYIGLENIYDDYYLYPRLKAADPGLYIYPQLRYTIFFAAMLVWGSVGITTTVLLLRSSIRGATFRGWPLRFLEAFLVIFTILLLGVIVGLWLRQRGF